MLFVAMKNCCSMYFTYLKGCIMNLFSATANITKSKNLLILVNLILRIAIDLGVIWISSVSMFCHLLHLCGITGCGVASLWSWSLIVPPLFDKRCPFVVCWVLFIGWWLVHLLSCVFILCIKLVFILYSFCIHLVYKSCIYLVQISS
jgi:hypothetical protein